MKAGKDRRVRSSSHNRDGHKTISTSASMACTYLFFPSIFNSQRDFRSTSLEEVNPFMLTAHIISLYSACKGFSHLMVHLLRLTI